MNTVIITLSDNETQDLHFAKKLHNSLTDSQRHVVRLAVSGFSNKEIAHRLVNSPQTIKRHVENITELAHTVCGKRLIFRKHIIPMMSRYYFLMDRTFLKEE